MGTDDLAKRRKKAKEEEDLQRVSKHRETSFVLIVCEGTKTEPLYLEELRKDFNIPKQKAVIEITGDCGSSPTSVVKYAIDTFKKSEKDYDYVYCVFDKDKHKDFQKAINMIKNSKNWQKNKEGHKATAEHIVSTPCFEFWLMLHFKYTTRPFGTGTLSPCQECIRELKKMDAFKQYNKGDQNIYTITKNKIETAIKNSQKIHKQATDDFQNPTTHFYKLIEFLKTFKI